MIVTLIGTMFIIVSTGLLGFYAPHLIEEAPPWVYLNCGISMFIYQTLDAIDGKQARRTGLSSPLGQLFDHGKNTKKTYVILKSFKKNHD